MNSAFKVGDRVRVVDAERWCFPAHGTLQTVSGHLGFGVTLEGAPVGAWYHEWRFELVARRDTLPDVLLDVIAERRRQDAKFGELGGLPQQTIAERMCVLAEEVGEAAKEVNELKQPGAKQRLRDELIQVAAVAVLLVQCLDIEEE